MLHSHVVLPSTAWVNVCFGSKTDTPLESVSGGKRTLPPGANDELWPLADRPLIAAFDPLRTFASAR
jgi:hypothetical protein